MGLFNEIQRIFNTEETPEVIPAATVDILGDIDSLTKDINKNKLLLINPELYKQFDDEIKKIREQWLNNQQLGNKKSNEIQGSVIESSVALRFKFDAYMQNDGKRLLIELYVKEIFEDCENIIAETNDNPTKVIELLAGIDKLQKSFSGFDFLINNSQLIEKLDQTRYEVIKIGYYLNRGNNGYVFSLDSVILFTKYIIHDAYTFLQNTASAKKFVKIKEDLELAIIFGSFEDANNLIIIFDLLQKVSLEAFTSQYEEEPKSDIELNLLPPITKTQIDEINAEIQSTTTEVLELQLYDNEHYQKYLDKLSKLKISFFNNPRHPKIVGDIKRLIFEINAHIQGYGEDKEQMKLVGATIKRINATKTDYELDIIAAEIENDPELSKIAVLKETIERVRLERSNLYYENMKKFKNANDILLYKKNIIDNATRIVNDASEKGNVGDKRVITEITRLLNEEPTTTSLIQLFVLINFTETNEVDYENYYQSFIGHSENVVKMIVRSNEYDFEEVPATKLNIVVKINKGDGSDRMNCAAHSFDLSGEEVDMATVLFNPNVIKSYSEYKLNSLVGSHQDQVIGLINSLAKSVVEKGLIPVFMINLALVNGLSIDGLREHIQSKLIELKNNPVIYSTLMNDDLFDKVKYIVDDYTKKNTESQAESMLQDLIPGLIKVDVTFLSLKAFFSYLHDLKFYDQLYVSYFREKIKQNSQFKK